MDKKLELEIKKEYQKRFGNKKFIPGKTSIPPSGKVFDEKELQKMVEAVLDGWWTEGRFNQEFEEKFAKWLGRKFCITVNSGSSANLLAISALTSFQLGENRLKKGDEIITTAAAFPTTINPIIQNNLIPVFVDIELGTYNADVDQIKKAIRPGRTKAIFLAHTLGNPFNLKEIVKICQKYNLWLIEDNCIDGERCSVVKIDGDIQVLTIKEIYNTFKSGKYRTFKILSHGGVIKEKDLYNLSDEFMNVLSKRQLSIVKLYKKWHGDTDKIVTKLGIAESSYYCSKWEIGQKMKKFIGVKYNWASVKNVIFKGNKSVINITQNFGQTCVTDNHRLMVFRNDQLSDKYTADFVNGKDSFVNLLVTDNVKRNTVDLTKYLEKYSQENGSIKYDGNWIWFKYNKKCWKGKMSELPKIKRHYKGFDLEMLCILFGLYCSEGNCGHELRFSSTNYNEIKLIVKCLKSISNLKHIRVSIDHNKKTKKVIRDKKVKSNKAVYSVNMGHEFINIVFSNLGGSDSYNKRVPNFIFNLEVRYMKIFYDYYIKGDGCKKSNDAIDFVITTASSKMAAGINLLNNLIFKRYSRFIIAKGKYYDVSPVKSLKYFKKKIHRIKSFRNVEVYDIVVEGTSTFVDACGNVLLHNCDALGSIYKNKKTGSFGQIATQSFYPAHHITMGEGGAVLTDDLILAKIIRSLRDWGRDCWCRTGQDDTCGKRFSRQAGDLPRGYDHKYIYSEIGYNLKITDMQAALGVAQLEKLDYFIKKRRENFDFLFKKMQIFSDYFILPSPEKFSQPSWFGFPLTLKNNCPFNREDLLKYLNQHKIGTRLLFAGNIIKQPHFQNYQINYQIVGDLKNTDLVMKNTFWIGVYPGLGKEELNFVVQKIKYFIASHN